MMELTSTQSFCYNSCALESENQVMVDNNYTLVARAEEGIIERRMLVTNELPKGMKAAKAEKKGQRSRGTCKTMRPKMQLIQYLTISERSALL